MICKYCEQELPADFFEKKRIAKGIAAKAGLAEAKARGKHIGRPREKDYSEIYKLRDSGKSLSKIAAIMKLAKSTVQHALKTREPLTQPTRKQE